MIASLEKIAGGERESPVSASVPIVIIQKVKGMSLRSPPMLRMSCS